MLRTEGSARFRKQMLVTPPHHIFRYGHAEHRFLHVIPLNLAEPKNADFKACTYVATRRESSCHHRIADRSSVGSPSTNSDGLGGVDKRASDSPGALIARLVLKRFDWGYWYADDGRHQIVRASYTPHGALICLFPNKISPPLRAPRRHRKRTFQMGLRELNIVQNNEELVLDPQWID